ncbi:hypothetical protein [Collimonas humicola]|uniref:hypothetical protein n=1 Tax=Collimonas humicola TaxID=2825886 RepID=UPI001B8BEE37|nr:hypothetical protein [Collimonas humicola]
MLKNLVVAIVGGLILWFVQDHFKDVATATYSISEAIEIPGSNGAAEYAQEIAVVNSGHSPVKAISIKVPHHISSYKLTKHSSLIKEEVVSEPNSFELVYPELPAGQKIRLLVRYDGIAIEKKWISVSHADGNGQAQENQSSSINYNWIWLAYFFGVISQSFGDIRRLKRESFRKWSSLEKIFRDDKPWFASSAEWSEMQFDAIQKTLAEYSFSTSVEQTAYYKLLNRPKPALLSEEHWAKLQKYAAELLMATFSKEVTRYSKTEKLIDFFKLKKPEALSHQSWTEFQKSLNAQIQNNLLPIYANEADFISILENNNSLLNSLPNSVASEIRTQIQQRYYSYLIECIKSEKRGDPFILIKIARLDLLTEDQSKSVKNNLLQFARMLGMPSRWRIQELKDFVSKKRPEWMPEDEFNSICELVSQAGKLSDERDAIRSRQRVLESEALETDQLKKRVLAQLELIDRVLTNPNSIGKIEDYDQTFAPGNRKNLELVASILAPG